MKLSFLIKGIFFVIFLAFSHEGRADSLKRVVLGLWDSSEYVNQDSGANEIHQNLEAILNHYGLSVEYVDVARGLPKSYLDKKKLSEYKGVVSWFLDEQMNNPKGYLQFLEMVSSVNLPFLLMGDFGFLIKDLKTGAEIDSAEVNKVLHKFDLDFKGDFFDNPMILEPEIKGDHSRVEFERKLNKEIKSVRMVNRMGEGESWLKINVLGGKDFSDVVFVNPKISYVQTGYETFTNPTSYKKQWRVNPFELVKQTFFKEGFDLVPDVTTLFGNRTFYTHIDGDGYINVSLTDRKTYSGQVIIDEIIKFYKLPIMVSIIEAEVSPEYLGNKSIEEEVREMFKLPNVEGGSHTFTHPMSWELEPSLEEKLSYLDDKEAVAHKGPIVGYPIKGYSMDYKREVVGSLDYINSKLMPEGKVAKTVLWSGSCMPPKAPLKILKEHKLYNMNGGDGKFDGVDASYTGLSPLYRDVDGYIQVYSSNANENLYTNLWEGPYSGFREVIEAFKNTEAPIRIRPINIYYHFYSGERVSSLKALKETYDYALSQKINPIYPSYYIEMVHGWMSTKIEKVKSDHYKMTDYGKIRTFRLDNTTKQPNYKLSNNIVGHKVLNNSLYIFIGEQETSEVILTDRKMDEAFINEASVFIDSFNGKEVKGHSFFPGYINIMNKGVMTNIQIAKEGEFSLKVPLE